MSCGCIAEAERKLAQDIAAFLAETQPVDAPEDAQYGKGRRGNALLQVPRPRNFTEPEFRILQDGATKSFIQPYTAQVIAAAAVPQSATDQ